MKRLFTSLFCRKFLFASLILFIGSLSGALQAQVVPDGTELTIDFTGLNEAHFDGDDYELTFTDNGQTYKMKIDIPSTGSSFIGANSPKTGVDNPNLVASSGTSILFDFNNDGTFGGPEDDFSVVSMNIGANSTDPGTRTTTVTPDGNTGVAFSIESNATTIYQFDLDNPSDKVSGNFTVADYTSIQSFSMVSSAFSPQLDNFVIVKGAPVTNQAPTNISLNSTSVNQSGGANATVGTLSTTDADGGDTHSYTLVIGTGDDDNGSFNINGSDLRATDASAFAAGDYSVRIQTDDGTDTYSKAFTITVVDDVAPSFENSTPSVGSITYTGGTVSADLNEDGTVYYVVVANGDGAPTTTHVKAGQNSAGVAALASGNFATSSTTGSQAFSGLAINAAYDLYAVAEDEIPNLQASAIKVDFNTSPPDGDADLTASGGVTEPVALPSFATSTARAVDVFDFTVSDGGGGDNQPLMVSSIDVQVSGTSTDAERGQVTWRLNGPDAAYVTGTYDPGTDKITFSGLSISVADGGNETYTLNAYFNDNTNLTEDRTFVLSIDGDTDVTTSGNSTTMGTTSAVNNGTGSPIDITATQLAFTTQPAGSVSGFALTTQPEVTAQDEAGNTDVDFIETITLTEASAGSLTNITQAATTGVATFTGLTYTATADQESFTLTANDQDDIGSNLPPVDANSVTSDVVASKLVFNTQPAPTSFKADGTSTSFATVPAVAAVDANDLVDTDYSTGISLAEVNGTGTAALTGTGDTDGSASTVTITPASGVSTFTGLEINYSLNDVNTDENFNLQATSGGLTSANSTQLMAEGNTAPTFTTLAGAVETNNEDTEAEITFADIAAQGDESDSDGTVEAFIVKTVSTGTLKIGANAGAATAFSATTNNSIDASNNAYWTPAVDANGTLDAFTITAKDNAGAESPTAVQAKVSVTPVNDAPTASGVTFSGTLKVGETLTGTYSYSDVEGDDENGTAFQWYRADDAGGNNQVAISGATNTTYDLTADETDKYISFEVIPSDGSDIGSAVESSLQGAIDDPFAGGEGTEANPYEIASALQLDYVRGFLNKHFILTADIDLGVSPWNDGLGWEPISDFTGALNGNGQEITNLFINRPSSDDVGLFGWNTSANIENIHLKNVDIQGGQSRTAAIASQLATGGVITLSSASGVINGTNWTAGVAGDNHGEISKTYFEGEIKGADNIGGLAGENRNLITDSYSTAKVEANDYVGGMTGWNTGSIARSYATGLIITTETNSGGLVGKNDGGTVTYSFWDKETTGQATSPGSAVENGLSTSEMKTKSTFTGVDWDTNTVWVVNPALNGGYPDFRSLYDSYPPVASNVDVSGTLALGEQLTGNYNYSDDDRSAEVGSTFKWYRSDDGTGNSKAEINGATSTTYTLTVDDIGKYISFEVTPNDGSTTGAVAESNVRGPVTSLFAGGTGTEADPFQIATAEQLNSVRNFSDKYFEQTADIDLGVSPWIDGSGWSPIANFSGHFNGKGNAIANLFIDRPGESKIGLFEIVTGDIEYVKLANVNITGDAETGSLAGRLTGSVSDSQADGEIDGGGNTGGLIGLVSSGQVYRSFANVEVKVDSPRWIGGLVGQLNGGSALIQDSYSTGDVGLPGTWEVGGLVGIIQSGGTIVRSYATGTVQGNHSLGGILGNLVSGTVTNSFWDKDSTGVTVSEGTGSEYGLTSEEMKTKSTFTDAGWDFDTVWKIGEPQNGSISYPYLQANLPENIPGGKDVSLADVETESSVSSITYSSGTVSGGIDDDGGTPVTDRGFVWSFSFEPDLDDNVLTSGDGTGDFSEIISDLPPGTTVYVRAYAVNSTGTVYGDEISFETEQKELTISGSFTVLNKEYDGNAEAVFDQNSLELTEIHPDHEVEISNIELFFEFEEVGEEIAVTIESAELIGEDANKYVLSLAEAPVSSADITVRPLTVIVDAQTIEYGEDDPELTYQVISGSLVDGEELSGVLRRESGKDAGTYAIEQGTLSAGANYTIDFTGANFTITTQELVVAAEDKSKVYGENDPELTFTVTGFENGDDEGVITGALTRETGEEVGNYGIEQGDLNAGDNYTIDFSEAVFTIEGRGLLVQVEQGQQKIYGQSDPEFTYQVTGFSLGDDTTILSGNLSRDEGESAGDYEITLGNLEAGENYELSIESALFTIEPAELVVIADSEVTKFAGETDPELTYQANGFAFDDNESLIEGTLSREEGEDFGSYAITIGTLDAGANYTIAFTGADFQILRTAPVLVSQSPEDTQEQVAVDAAVYIDFDQEVTLANESGISLSDESGTTIDITAEVESNRILITHSGLQNLTTYTVTVAEDAVENLDGVGNEELTWSFTTIVELPEPVVLSSPGDSSGSVAYAEPLNFSWQASPVAGTYEMELAPGADFTTPIFQSGAIEETSVLYETSLSSGQAYQWRVRAVNQAGPGPWSDPSMFVTQLAPVTLTFPEDGTTGISTAPRLQWDKSVEASVSMLRFGSDSQLTTTLIDLTTESSSHLLEGLSAEQAYYWQVQDSAIIEGVPTASGWSDIHAFTTRPDPQDTEDEPVVVTIDFGGTSGSGNGEPGENPSQTDPQQTDYRMIGLPGTDGIRLNDFFEGPYRDAWRAFFENGSELDFYDEFQPDDNRFTFTPGQGFWVLSTEAVIGERRFEPVATNGSDAYGFEVHPGWNIIANPYQSPVEWSLIEAFNGIESPLYGYQQSFVSVDILKPFEGYYYYNDPVWEQDSLFIPYTGYEQRGTAKVARNTSELLKDAPQIKISMGAEGKAQNEVDLILSRPMKKSGEVTIDRLHPNLGLAMSGMVITDDEHSRLRYNRKLVSDADLTSYYLEAKTAVGDTFDWRMERLNQPNAEAVLLINKATSVSFMITADMPAKVKATEPVSRYELYIGGEQELMERQASLLPATFSLSQNYPNPFNPSTNIRFSVPERAQVTLEIYDILGRRVQSLVNEAMQPGWHVVSWNASQLSSGVYLYRLQSGNTVFTKKLTLIK